MNFSKFRQTGELSDITVVVDDTEFKLHKFPLYAKSDFFCALAKSPGTDCNRVELKEFPGGPEAFAVVADFCYNMKVDLTKTNVVHIRCAAEVLQMTGSGNLSEVSDKFLQDTITSAKMSRSTSAIASLLISCMTATAVAEKADIVSACCDALVDCWSKPPTKFSTPSVSKKGSNEKSDESVWVLLGLPVPWLVKLLALARVKGSKSGVTVELATKYVNLFIDKSDAEDKMYDSKKGDTSDTKPAKGARGAQQEVDLVKDARQGMKSKKKNESGKVLDAIISEMPEESFSDPSITTDWITKVLKFATAHGCKCRPVLVRIAGERLNSLSADDLCIISPSVLKDIVSESCNGDATQGLKACQLMENYMNEMARKGVLTAETYKTLVTSGPADARKSHDSLYGILEYVLTAEKDKLTQEQKSGLMDTVNFSLLTEATLKRAFETQVVPAAMVAKGALSLCSRLKSELESAKNTVCRQEDELQRLRRAKTVTPQMTSSPQKETESSHSSFSELPVRDIAASGASNHVIDHTGSISPVAPSTEDVLMAARNKLASSVAAYNTFRPLSADREPEYAYEDDMTLDYKYDRHMRSYDNARNKTTRTATFRSSYLYPHRM
ncbi:uncharacterized protein LOC127841274 [Dreissena polymorpha]|uniref:Uncharacterized protein n=1 Tax=Dreissena polymorpha TaxID=45954 RepID=A0A9D4EVR6_DREPO|nr:uncharacterized protein LOC127841274 [Dreissena polymorpha]KAH3787137.1 hypothetical protein DPMN_165257 [Dreissena polymorpha]